MELSVRVQVDLKFSGDGMDEFADSGICLGLSIDKL